MWDVTVTVAASYFTASSTMAASAAESAAQRKETKYAEISKPTSSFLSPSKLWAQSTEQEKSSSQDSATVFLHLPRSLVKPVFYSKDYLSLYSDSTLYASLTLLSTNHIPTTIRDAPRDFTHNCINF
jgi:hypothetical protein